MDAASTQELRQLLAAAQGGAPAALAPLREWLDGHPEVWRRLGDLAAHAAEALVALASGGDPLAGESMRRRMGELEAGLTGAAPTQLEELLAKRVVLCWAQAHLADLDAMQQDRGATPLAAHAIRRQGEAQRRLSQAVRSLATARRLLPAADPQPPALRVVG